MTHCDTVPPMLLFVTQVISLDPNDNTLRLQLLLLETNGGCKTGNQRALSRRQTIDKFDQLLWAWFSFQRKSADEIVEP